MHYTLTEKKEGGYFNGEQRDYTFEGVANLIGFQVNEPRNWFVGNGGRVMDAYAWINLYRNAVPENEMLLQFTTPLIPVKLKCSGECERTPQDEATIGFNDFDRLNEALGE